MLLFLFASCSLSRFHVPLCRFSAYAYPCVGVLWVVPCFSLRSCCVCAYFPLVGIFLMDGDITSRPSAPSICLHFSPCRARFVAPGALVVCVCSPLLPYSKGAVSAFSGRAVAFSHLLGKCAWIARMQLCIALRILAASSSMCGLAAFLPS